MEDDNRTFTIEINKDIGIKELVLRLIVETPMDSPDGKNASRAKVKLDALRLLADINKNNSTAETHQDLLSILAGEE